LNFQRCHFICGSFYKSLSDTKAGKPITLFILDGLNGLSVLFDFQQIVLKRYLVDIFP